MHYNKKIFHRDVLLSTIFTFLLLGLVKLIFVNTEYLNPIAKVFEDFQFTDIYYSEFKKNKTDIDTNIVLVNIGENDRQGIARQLVTIKSFNPKLIGIDVTFRDRKDDFGDSVLKAALSGTPPVISVCNIIYNDTNHPSAFQVERSNPFFERNGQEGFGNFLGEEMQTVRYYTPFLYQGKEQYPAFTTKIIQATYPQAYSKLVKRGKKTELINYQSDNFVTLDANELNGSVDLNILRNKIVLLGYMGPGLDRKVFEDNHLTPLNKSYGGMALPDKYGVEIHANIISMIINGDYITEAPATVIYLFAFIICMLHMYVFIYLFLEHHKWFHVGAICLQIVSFALIIYLSLMLFHHFKIKLEPAYIVIGVLLSVEALYFYEAIVKFLHTKFGFKSCFAKGH